MNRICFNKSAIRDVLKMLGIQVIRDEVIDPATQYQAISVCGVRVTPNNFVGLFKDKYGEIRFLTNSMTDLIILADGEET